MTDITKELAALDELHEMVSYFKEDSRRDNAIELVRAKLTEMKAMIELLSKDWADDDTRIKELAKAHLTQEEIDGDPETGFVSVIAITEMLVEKIKQRDEAMVELASIGGEFDIGDCPLFDYDEGCNKCGKTQWSPNCSDLIITARIERAMSKAREK